MTFNGEERVVEFIVAWPLPDGRINLTTARIFAAQPGRRGRVHQVPGVAMFVQEAHMLPPTWQLSPVEGGFIGLAPTVMVRKQEARILGWADRFQDGWR